MIRADAANAGSIWTGERINDDNEIKRAKLALCRRRWAGIFPVSAHENDDNNNTGTAAVRVRWEARDARQEIDTAISRECAISPEIMCALSAGL
jgi:hypothetical protein